MHQVYLVPGLFGFTELLGFDYFGHVRRAIEARFAAKSIGVRIHVVVAPPTSSIRFRARILAKTIAAHQQEDLGPIHIVGHSTGGLDARLIMSPTSNLKLDAAQLTWLDRVDSVVSLNTPHHGTPLASYFATASGTRALYALSLLTVLTLSLGESPLSATAQILALLGRIDARLGRDVRILRQATDRALRYIDRAPRRALKQFLSQVHVDQGGIVQIMPEAMDLFNASTQDSRTVRYGSIACAAPPPRFLRPVRKPGASTLVYLLLHPTTGAAHRFYGYAEPTTLQERRIRAAIPYPIDCSSSDGIVPTLSMIHGELLWAGEADHLDVLGHFHDDERPVLHTDWLRSGACFSRARFSRLMDSVVEFQLRGHKPTSIPRQRSFPGA